MRYQSGIFVEGNANRWFLAFVVSDSSKVADALAAVLATAKGTVPNDTVEVVVGFGAELARQLMPLAVPADFPVFAGRNGPTHRAPASHVDLALWIHSDRHDRNFDVASAARRTLAPLGSMVEDVPGFEYFDARDLHGFIDGTENPDVDEARDLVVIKDGNAIGGSFLFAQRWVHDLDAFRALSVSEQEQVFGRTKATSVELDPLPATSHVGRVVTEDEDGQELEIYRRSFPYGTSGEAGLQFLAFTADPTIIDGMLDRMFGIDGPSDRLIDFSRAVNGSFTFVPSAEAIEALVRPAS
ncbi:MAG: Dyp-type peroxidase [Acidimicrobiales bacterium]